MTGLITQENKAGDRINIHRIRLITRGVTNIFTVRRSATAVKVKSQRSIYPKKPFGQRSNKNFSGQNTLQSLKSTMKHNAF